MTGTGNGQDRNGEGHFFYKEQISSGEVRFVMCVYAYSTVSLSLFMRNMRTYVGIMYSTLYIVQCDACLKINQQKCPMELYLVMRTANVDGWVLCGTD